MADPNLSPALAQTLPWIATALLLFACLCLLWLALQNRGMVRSLSDAIVRLETRLETQTNINELRAHASDDLLRDLDVSIRGAQSDLRTSLERRLGELEFEQSEMHNAAHLRTIERVDVLQNALHKALAEGRAQSLRALIELREAVKLSLSEQRELTGQRQTETLKVLHDTVQQSSRSVERQLAEALSRNSSELGQRFARLTDTTDQRLKEISGEVEKRLSEGFEKTTATFADVVKRLALIDQAQKKITELSTNVVSLQAILADKRSRGAFGEVQLNALIRNILPSNSYALQHRLSNERIADCILFLPQPTGNVAIDAKFPLEAFQAMTKLSIGQSEYSHAERQFKRDIRRHINDIASKYIVPGETSSGAVMFIPAEAVFAEIQARHPDLVQSAHRAHVWMVSPTTLMAILNTARAVLKDEATQRQVHVIQEHLAGLSVDFERFQKRMENLSRHITLAHKDVDDAKLSAQKISSRFEKIEQVDFDEKINPLAKNDS